MSATNEDSPISRETSIVLEVLVSALAADRSVFDPELAEITEDLLADRLTGEPLSSLVRTRRDGYVLAETSVGGFTPGKILMLLTEAKTQRRHLSSAAAGLVLDWSMRNLDDQRLPFAVSLIAPFLGTYSRLTTPSRGATALRLPHDIMTKEDDQ